MILLSWCLVHLTRLLRHLERLAVAAIVLGDMGKARRKISVRKILVFFASLTGLF